MAADGKLLAYLLRHRPQSMGLVLDAQGWVEVKALLAALEAHGHPTTRDELIALVASDTKERFAMAEGRIRAQQGHSLPVDLQLTRAEPPAQLFHGTSARFLKSIEGQGLRAGERHHVHLSVDRQGAEQVASRRKQPVVLTIDARAMVSAGHAFFRSANGVWLVEAVPPGFLSSPEQVG